MAIDWTFSAAYALPILPGSAYAIFYVYWTQKHKHRPHLVREGRCHAPCKKGMGHATGSRMKVGRMLQDEKSEKDKSIIRQCPPTTPGDALTGQGELGLREPPKSGTRRPDQKKTNETRELGAGLREPCPKARYPTPGAILQLQ